MSIAPESALGRISGRYRTPQAPESLAHILCGLDTSRLLIAAGENFPPLSGAFVIEKGLAALASPSPSGRMQITYLYLRGDIAGLHRRAAGEPGYLRALHETKALAVSETEIAKAMLDETVQQAVLQHCRRELRISSEWVANLGGRSALERVARLICELVIRSGVDTTDNEFEFPVRLTQAQLAEVVGTSDVHAHRCLQELKREGLVYPRGKNWFVQHWVRLMLFCDFNPSYLS